MEIYSHLLKTITENYDVIRRIKETERGSLSVIRHRDTGKKYVFRHFKGSGEVYRRLLTVQCPYLPQIMEVGEWDGQTAVLEEYIQGDTLAFLLEGDLLTVAQAKKIMIQLGTALWVLHSLGGFTGM